MIESLNGYLIIASENRGNGDYDILGFRADIQEFVIAYVRNENDNYWLSGTYTKDFDQAVKIYNLRRNN